MLDFKLTQDAAQADFDISISPSGDFETVNDFSTSILTSLLTDRRATDEQVVVPEFRRGWIGDIEPITPGYQIGSHLWLIEPSKATQQTVTLAASAATEALQWMIDQGVALDVQVTGELTGPRTATLTIAVTAPDGSVNTEFLELWENTAFVPTELPAPIVDPEPFSPASIPDLVVWGDADLSPHTIDDDCGVITTRDLANNADYFQSQASQRPLRLRGANGWLYRFDGVDDFLATSNQPFASITQGSAFFVYKPTAGATVSRRFFSLGPNGFEASVRGLAFIQDAADVIRVLGASGDLDISVTGPSSGDAPVGIVVRWGPGANGADIEITTGGSNLDASYSPDVQAINQAVLGAGFDGAAPDASEAAGFENNVFAFYSRRVTDVEAFNLLEYAGTRLFSSPVGEQFDDCFFFDDDFGLVDG